MERVHAAENEVLSKTVFNSKSIYEKVEPGSKEHKQNIEKMVTDVKECIQQAKFNKHNLEVHRGVGDEFVSDDDDKLKSFLTLSEEGKPNCTWSYKVKKNKIAETLSLVWGTNLNYTGNYKNEYLRIINTLFFNKQTSWKDKYQTTLWSKDDKRPNHDRPRHILQPLPDYI